MTVNIGEALPHEAVQIKKLLLDADRLAHVIMQRGPAPSRSASDAF